MKMNIITQNPFRILGLIANSSEKELQKQIGIIKRYAEVGKTKSFDYDFEFIGDFTRTSDEIQQASNSIEQAHKKLLYSLFWFVKNNQFDEIAFNNLKERDTDKAIEIWNKTLKDEITSKNYSSYLNLSTLYIALSIIDDQIELQKLQTGISLKGDLIHSENLKDFSKLVTGNGISNDPIDISKNFVDEIIDFLKPYLNKKNGISTNDLISLFNTFPTSIKKYISVKFTEIPISSIENKIEKTTRKRNDKPRDAEEHGEELYKSTKSDVILLKKLLGKDDVQFQMIANKLANEILQCSIDFFNIIRKEELDFDPGDDALKIAMYANLIGATGQIQNRIDESIKSIQDWVESSEERNINTKIGKEINYIIDKIELASKTLNDKGMYPKGYDDPYSELPINEQTHNKYHNAENTELGFHLVKFSDHNINFYRLSRDIVDKCRPKLNEIKNIVGEGNDIYRKISNDLAGVALACLIEYINNEGNPRLGIAPDITENQINAMDAIGGLWMTNELYTNYKKQKEALYNMYRPVRRSDPISTTYQTRQTVSSKGCYIATMAYGDYNHPKVMVLRKFRDENLSNTFLGRSFISFYYATSPHLVKFLKNKKYPNKIIKNLLDKFVNKVK